jgi:hypothetical protein
MPGPFQLRNYATFTGPLQFDELAYSYELSEKEGLWPFDIPINSSFPNYDIGVLFYRDLTDYTHFHCFGPSPQVLVLEKQAYMPLPGLFLQVLNTIINGNIITNGIVVSNGLFIQNGISRFNGILSTFGYVLMIGGAFLTGLGDVMTYCTLTRAIAISKKSFDIPHPTKEEHRLRYVCVETPKADVYVRGKLNGSNVIDLPDYWKDLVDSDNIDVVLTPRGSFQELFVEDIQWGTKVIVKNNAGGPIHCSYVVYGERKDVSPNIPEYRGLTKTDYPGDNSEYNVNS